MWSFMVIVALLFSLIIALFALANQQPVEVSYFFGEREVSAVLLILGSACGGALVMALLGIVTRIKTMLQLRDLRKQNLDQQAQLESYQEECRKLQDQLLQLSTEKYESAENPDQVITNENDKSERSNEEIVNYKAYGEQDEKS